MTGGAYKSAAIPALRSIPHTMDTACNPATSSYRQIVTSSAIMGGAQGADLLLRTARTKVIALLLGPSGLGLVALFQSIIDLVGTLSGLGLNSSGVRQISEAAATGETTTVARSRQVLRTSTLMTGLLGASICVFGAAPLSHWVFENRNYSLLVALLGISVLIEAQTKAGLAILQGTRRISDLASIQLLSAIGITAGSIALYAWLGLDGILPVFVLSSLISLVLTSHYTRKLGFSSVRMTVRMYISESRGLLIFGLAHMWGALVGAMSAFAVRALIQRQFGLDGIGVYQAAWALSGLFASFILSAMAVDYYPRLTAAAIHDGDVNRLVDEQTEVVVLLALPGILSTMALGPFLIRLLFSSAFSEASIVLPWLIVGVFVQVVSWPAGFIQLAKGAGAIFALSQTAFYSLHMIAVYWGLLWLGLPGAGMGFAVCYVLHVAICLSIGFYLSGYLWSRSLVNLVATSAALVLSLLVMTQAMRPAPTAYLGLMMSLATGLYSLRRLVNRLGPEHLISRTAVQLPIIHRVL